MRDELRAFWFPHQYLHSVEHVPEPGCPPQRTGNIHHCIHFLCCCLLQKQITTSTAASNNTDAWFYSSIDQKSGSGPISLKSRCQQGCGPFQRLQQVFPCLFGLLAKFSSLDVIELRSHFLAACQLRVVSTFYFHSLACGLFLHFQSQQQPYEAVRVTCGETKGPKECQGSSGLCHQSSAWSSASGTRLGETEAH